MNIHEYQGKSILASFGVPIQRGVVASTPEEALEGARKLKEETGTGWFVVKAQIHAGGRGKGTITETGSRGVVLAKSLDEVPEKAKGILGGHLVTLQTKATGKKVSKVYIAEDVYGPGASEPKEFYMSLLLDRAISRVVLVYSPDGGMNIEEVAHNTPERIFRETIDPLTGLSDFQARKIAFNLGLGGQAFKNMIGFVKKLYKAYVSIDASLFEINPVLKTSDDRVIAVDAKVTLDNNGLDRHPDYAAMRDTSEEDPIEVEASDADLNYVKLEGNVGCMVNGA
ncbi:MAG: succinate--CoA ligase subunit beta, partial [Flavobacteriales bacterium]|nr:succinate--CoA ligase subunit beta [Flavobacteriales bacterium]